MALGRKTGGRKPGSENKTTVSVKSALTATFDNLGGIDAMSSWARENQTEFYKLYAKLLPAELTVNHNGLERLADKLAALPDD